MNAIERLRFFAGGHYTANFPHYAEDVAAVDALYQAAKERAAYGHNDTCDTELSPGSGYDCTCGHDALAAAVRRVEGD